MERVDDEGESGAKCADLCHKHMTERAFCNWKAKFGYMTVLEAKRLKVLEAEEDQYSIRGIVCPTMECRTEDANSRADARLAAMKELLSRKR